jgi:hypothetical protein
MSFICPCPLVSRDAFEHVGDLFAQPRTNLGSVCVSQLRLGLCPALPGD